MSALPVPQAGSPVWTSISPHLYEDLAHKARLERDLPWPQPLLRDYAAYFTEGNRTRYETAVFARTGRLTRAVVMTLVTGPSTAQGQEWLLEVIDGILLLCEQATWCWPAHDDTFTKNGWMVPDPASHYVDLGAGEVAGQLAWIDHVLGAQLDERVAGLRERIRTEVLSRIFTPFLSRVDWHWLGLHGHVHNWCPWIHSNIAIAAGVLLDHGETRTEILKRCDEGIGRFWDAIPVDGAIDEGYEYWWNGAARAFEGMDYLRWMGYEPTLKDPKKLDNTLQFPLRMQLSARWFINVADASAKPPTNQPWQVMFRWGQHLNLPQARDMAVGSHLRNRGDQDRVDTVAPQNQPVVEFSDQPGLGRTLLELSDMVWQETVAGAQIPGLPLPQVSLFESVDLVIEREKAGSDRGFAMSLKGGHNDENHNHNDLGSVIIALDGVPVIVDAGRKAYEAKTFSDRRYEIWCNTSAWHCVPVVAGREQNPGRDVTAGPLVHSDSGATSTWSLDLSRAYGLARPNRWGRELTLDRGRHRVKILDSWDLSAVTGADQTRINLMVHGEPREITANSFVVGDTLITHNGVFERVELAPDGDDPLLFSAWENQLFRVTFAPGQMLNNFEVTVSRAGEGHDF